MSEIITSTQNPKVKQALKLRDGKERKEKNLILIEGAREVFLALGSNIKIETLFYCPELAGENSELFLLINKKIIIQTSADVFKKMAYRDHPDGVLAIAEPNPIKLNDIRLSKNPLVIVVEAVEKPGNLGAILRSADAAGVDAVIISDPKTDIYNPNVIRASLGTVFSNQVAASTTEEVIKWLADKKIKSFAALPRAEKVYTLSDYTGFSAIVIGAEDVGLSDKWVSKADEQIKITMKGKIDSLNASVCLAVVLFEALRQRGQ